MKILIILIAGLLSSSCNSVIYNKDFLIVESIELVNAKQGKYKVIIDVPNYMHDITLYTSNSLTVGDTIKICY